MKAATACALALLLASPSTGFARDSLPWKDANPFVRAQERPRAKAAHRQAEAPKAEPVNEAGPAAAGIPVPEARPASASDPASSKKPEAKEAPSPEAAKPEPRPADAPPVPEPATAAKPAEPGTAPDPSVTDIPVPDKRPAPTPAEVAPEPTPPAAATVPVPLPEPVQPPADAAPEPVDKPEDAPNSTEKLKSRETEVTPAASAAAAAAVEDAIACEAELKARGAAFTVEETISEGECGVLRPVALKRLSSGIAVSPKTQMLCRAALALDDWMTQSVVPAAKADLPGETLTEFRHASTYVCRPRASETGISEHARGSAIDIGSFVFKSGREIGIAAKEANTPDETFLEAVRAGACGPFKTVLGPGTDVDHATHFHLDIAARKNGATYCK